MRVVNVAVGCPAASVAIDVETDSHEGNCWVGAVMRGTSTSVSQSCGCWGCRNRCSKGAVRRERGQQQPRNEAEEGNRNER